jgi:hypothetical protein
MERRYVTIQELIDRALAMPETAFAELELSSDKYD